MSPRVRAAVPVVVLVVHASLYGAWIVDDAGITFAYARNVAAGHGFVAQPGDPPVEGFTNLLWLLVLLAPMKLGVFDPVAVPKLLGIGCAAGALWLVHRTALREQPRAAIWIDAAAIVTAANPGLAIWAASGLENGLTALLVAAAYANLARALPDPTPRSALVAGGLAALLFANRPDGALYAAVYPAAIVMQGHGELGRRTRCAIFAATIAAAGLGAITLWRWLEFADLVPNTFHAKGQGTGTHAVLALLHGAALLAAAAAGPRVRSSRIGRAALFATILWILHSAGARGQLRSLAGDLGWPLLSAAWWMLALGSPARGSALWSFALMALIQLFALPGDWMGEYRFGTPLLLVAPTAIAATLGPEIARIQQPRVARLARALVVALVVLLAVRFGVRAHRFAVAPAVPMESVTAAFEESFLRWAAAIDRPDATLLTPDVGGILWRGGLRIFDLAGLCNREIAALYGRDRRALADHILLELRPTFVELHGSHAWRSGLTDDPRFARDYVGVTVETDEWLSRTLHVDTEVGSYVRRDAVPEGVGIRDLRSLPD